MSKVIIDIVALKVFYAHTHTHTHTAAKETLTHTAAPDIPHTNCERVAGVLRAPFSSIISSFGTHTPAAPAEK